MVTRTEEKHMTPTAEALADRRKELDDARWSMEDQRGDLADDAGRR